MIVQIGSTSPYLQPVHQYVCARCSRPLCDCRDDQWSGQRLFHCAPPFRFDRAGGPNGHSASDGRQREGARGTAADDLAKIGNGAPHFSTGEAA